LSQAQCPKNGCAYRVLTRKYHLTMCKNGVVVQQGLPPAIEFGQRKLQNVWLELSSTGPGKG